MITWLKARKQAKQIKALEAKYLASAMIPVNKFMLR